jgi:hypothetical protein
MNVHTTCTLNDHETGPPFTAFTPEQASLCARYFDYPDLVELALKGNKESENSLHQELVLLAKDAKREQHARELLNLLAYYGLKQAQHLLANT